MVKTYPWRDEIWYVSEKKKEKCVSLRVQRRVEVGLIYDILTWCMLMTLSSYLFLEYKSMPALLINPRLDFTTMYINIDRFIRRMRVRISIIRHRGCLEILYAFYKAKYCIAQDSNEMIDSHRREWEGGEIWSLLLLIWKQKEEKERNSVFIIVVRRSALGKGRSSFKVGERLYYTDSFGSILPTLHSSIHYKFPDSCSIRREAVVEVECRGIFVMRRTSILCPIVNDSLQFHQFVYFATNESRNEKFLFSAGTINRNTKMRNRRKCNFEVTRGNNCLSQLYRLSSVHQISSFLDRKHFLIKMTKKRFPRFLRGNRTGISFQTACKYPKSLVFDRGAYCYWNKRV